MGGGGDQHEGIFPRDILKVMGLLGYQKQDETIVYLLSPFLTDMPTLKRKFTFL